MNPGIDCRRGVRTPVRAPSAFPGRGLTCVLLPVALAACLAIAAPGSAAAAADTPPPSHPFPPAGYDSLRTPLPPGTDLPRMPVDTLTTRTVDGRVISRGGNGHALETGEGRDTTRMLPFGAQLWGEGGLGGMVGPDDVRKYFQVGLGGNLTFRAEGRPWFATALRVGLQSIPRADQFQVVTDRGVETITLGGNALQVSVAVGPGVRVWRRLWLETGVGVAHLHVSGGNEALGSLADAAAITAVRNTTGLAAEAQLAWRFPITDTQSMSLGLGWQGNRAGETDRWINYVPFRIGYRFL